MSSFVVYTAYTHADLHCPPLYACFLYVLCNVSARLPLFSAVPYENTNVTLSFKYTHIWLVGGLIVLFH